MPPVLAMFSSMPWWAWAGFLAFVALMLALDLGVFNRKAHVVSLKEALAWCAVWFGLAMAFNLLVALKMPDTATSKPALEFFTGYIVEMCLSVDNVFVFIVIFQYFRVEPKHQHRVLFWGILGAVVMRAVFIFAGISLINRFHWIIYVFGAFLVYTGIKLALPKQGETASSPRRTRGEARAVHPGHEPLRGRPFLHPGHQGRRHGHADVHRADHRRDDRRDVRPRLAARRARDHAQRASSRFTSNIFAILGLRSLYFALNGIMQLFRYLNIGLAAHPLLSSASR
jgi:tellurite resistance protein TerC